jgi:hypothetical protein
MENLKSGEFSLEEELFLERGGKRESIRFETF